MLLRKIVPILLVLLDCSLFASAQKTDESRFTINTLVSGLDEPMEMGFLPDGKVLFVERKGNLKLYDPIHDYLSVVAEIPCNTKYINAQGHVREAEEGLMGIAVDPEFEKNHWIYIYYSDPDEPKHLLTRWEFVDDQLVEESRKVVLEIPAQRQECCHTGGGMVFDPDGNLYITVGNNTSNGNSNGYAPLDERPGREPWDDQRGAANTNDLRGSVVRIKPEDDGTYSIPEGNLFPEGMPKTRPEIYAKGARNPWRPTIDTHSGYLYWGEVGPDAPVSSEMGPAGYDEFNQAKKAGFFGWPYFAGNNEPYADFDFETKKRGDFFDLKKTVNNSSNNTGLTVLPSPTPAFIWYPYNLSEQFPLLGVSGRSATGVAVFHQSDFKKPERLWPDYYEGKLLIADFMRGWIMAVTMDENSDYVSMERFLPKENFSSLIDMEFSPSGDLYILKYGSSWFAGADNSALIRIEYNAGNRPPVVKMVADKVNGALPLELKMTAEGTFDPDKDDLTYAWELKESEQVVARTSGQITSEFKITKHGLYTVVLKVTDKHGSESKKEIEIKAGNTAPEINIHLKAGNKSFYFPDTQVVYEVDVVDQEDGSLKTKEILSDQVSVNVDYVPETFDPIEISSNYATADAQARFSTGYKLISKNDCGSCHMKNQKSIGPSYTQIAERYRNTSGANNILAQKIINGGQGVWGDHAMAAHPQLQENEASSMVSYILSLSDKPLEAKSLPVSGKFKTNVPAGETGYGGWAVRSAYTDHGGRKVPAIFSEEIVFLKYPFLDPRDKDFYKNTEDLDTPTKVLQFFGDQSFIGFKDIDLTGISSLDLLIQASKRTSSAGGIIEIRQGSPTGELLGKTQTIEVMDRDDSMIIPDNEKSKKIRVEQARRMQAGAAEYFLGQSRVLNVPIKPTSENVDLYFVINSPKAETNQIVLSFSGIEFNQ